MRTRSPSLLLALWLLGPSPSAAEQAAPPERFELEVGLARGARPLDADRAAALAAERAPSVARARAASALARAGADEAFVPMMPRVELTARYLRIGGFEDGTIGVLPGDMPWDTLEATVGAVQDPAARTVLSGLVAGLSSMGGVAFEIPRNQIGLRASLTYPLSDLLLTLLPAWRAAEAREELERWRVEAARADVELAARETYYRYAQARAGLEVALASARLVEGHRDRVAAMVGAELAVDADLALVEARLAEARGAAARARGGVAVAEAALGVLLGLDPAGGFALAEQVTRPLAPPPELDEEGLARAWAARPEVRALEGLLVVQGHQARAASGGYWPRLLLVAGADYASPNARVIPPSEDFTPSWEVGAVLSFSPSDALRASAAARRVRAMRESVEADLASLRDGVRLGATRAREEQLAAAGVLAAAAERVAAAERGYRAREAELRAGEAVVTELVDADLEVVRARLELVAAGVDARIAAARLRHALGEPGVDGPQ